MEIFEIHPENPQARALKRIAEIFKEGGIVVYPTDSGYSMGCDVNNVKAIQKLYQLKRGIKKYVMALMFQNFSDITEYCKVDNNAYRFMKARTPGPYTFILPSQIHIHRKLKVNRPEIGVRMPDHVFLKSLHEFFEGPILNTAAKLSEEDVVISVEDIIEVFGKQVDAIVNFGDVPHCPTNIINLMGPEPEIIRGEDLLANF
jgi:tRNA threonylcarbamoyl adenosine modification protein (Sua5/YciO/YrdC/YwlC family)